MIKESVTKALTDAKIQYKDIDQACVGYVFGINNIYPGFHIQIIIWLAIRRIKGDSTSGQRGLYDIGLTGIPIYNVNNNCATGATALLLGKQFIEAGSSNCVLCVGFEKMKPGSLGTTIVPYRLVSNLN